MFVCPWDVREATCRVRVLRFRVSCRMAARREELSTGFTLNTFSLMEPPQNERAQDRHSRSLAARVHL